PAGVRVLAAYWLEALGRPLDGGAAEAILLRDAETGLMAFDWESAERSLTTALAANPRSREAHALLGQVYLSRYQYWHDWAQLDRELFPGISTADPEMFGHLADKGREELERAEKLPARGGPAPEGFGESLAETESGEAAPHFLLGKIHFLKGEMEAARREMETVLELDRGRGALPAYARLYLARIARAAGDLPAARRHLEEIVAMAPAGRVTKTAKEELKQLSPAGGR
ncbi:MAG TPA: tetratricopeptide repeat protein, partial [Candidatus Polarisedimenticolia bacterium]|nr:tetratricopeptide repeat protein [Candidatus Polarisedimenticolia bacterium]